MRKRISSLALVVLAIGVKSQVGIATASPNATLDVTGKPTTTTVADGIIAPRLSLANLNAKSSYGTNQTGAIVYINNITGTTTGATANINAIGYYYFDGSKWIKFVNDPENIYNTNGSLAGNRTVTQGTNTLAFNNNIVNGFSVATNALSVDGANNRVGIGTTTPTRKLQVEGSGLFNAYQASSPTFDALEISIGKDMFSYGNRKENFGILIKSDISVNKGPIARINFGDTSITSIAKTSYLSFSVGNTLNELMYLTDANNGRIGIGTSSPTNTLHIKATTDPIKLEGLQADTNATNIVVADASGTLKTIPKSSLASTNIYNTDGSLTGNRTVTQGANTLGFTSTATNGFSVDGSTFSVDAANDRVGMGTNAPTNALHVKATANPVKLEGLQADTNATNIVVADASGTLKTIPKSSLASTNIYNTDGSLTGNRTVTQGTNTLGFTSTATNGFSVDGSTFSVDAANDRVGIGTTTPTRKLHTEGSGYFNAARTWKDTKEALEIAIGEDMYSWGNRAENFGVLIKSASTSNPAKIARINFGDTSLNGLSGTKYLSFSVGNSLNELMYLTDANNGRIGIGTTTPTNTLHIKATADPLKLEGLSADATAPNILVADAAGVLKTIPKTSLASTNIYNADGSLSGNRTVTQGANTLGFTSTATNGFSVDGSTFSVDAANDRVGIGTTTPTRKLHTEGSGYFNAIRTIATTKDALEINIGEDGLGYGNRGENFGIHIKSASTAAPGSVARINFGDASPTSAGAGRYLSFSVGTGLKELMYLTDNNNGRIGIGTTTPTAMLDVNGDIATSGKVYTATSTYADYVFEKYFTGKSELNNKYNFTVLKDVKSFVEKNHHLPGVTPVTAVKKEANGYKFDMSSLVMQQLEKLEELYLHVIEQQEQLEIKESKINTLQNKLNDLEKRLEKIESKK